MKDAGIRIFETGPGREALKRHCRKSKIPISAIEQLVEAELEQVGKLKRRGIGERFDEILDEILDNGRTIEVD